MSRKQGLRDILDAEKQHSSVSYTIAMENIVSLSREIKIHNRAIHIVSNDISTLNNIEKHSGKYHGMESDTSDTIKNMVIDSLSKKYGNTVSFENTKPGAMSVMVNKLLEILRALKAKLRKLFGNFLINVKKLPTMLMNFIKSVKQKISNKFSKNNVNVDDINNNLNYRGRINIGFVSMGLGSMGADTNIDPMIYADIISTYLSGYPAHVGNKLDQLHAELKHVMTEYQAYINDERTDIRPGKEVIADLVNRGILNSWLSVSSRDFDMTVSQAQEEFQNLVKTLEHNSRYIIQLSTDIARFKELIDDSLDELDKNLRLNDIDKVSVTDGYTKVVLKFSDKVATFVNYVEQYHRVNMQNVREFGNFFLHAPVPE